MVSTHLRPLKTSQINQFNHYLQNYQIETKMSFYPSKDLSRLFWITYNTFQGPKFEGIRHFSFLLHVPLCFKQAWARSLSDHKKQPRAVRSSVRYQFLWDEMDLKILIKSIIYWMTSRFFKYYLNGLKQTLNDFSHIFCSILVLYFK